MLTLVAYICFFFFQAEDGIRDLVRSRGLGDVYKRQVQAVLKKLGVAPMGDIDEATLLRTDGSAYVFPKPKVQTSMQSQCLVITGNYTTKSAAEMAPFLAADIKKALETKA
eukprot:TRINITY_DN30733_c0_g1_i3.p1 TRINITY_DN30733_c0_g1~~TRINITY_DN30733_c0_g1_i3.p1  ORF type:complete len:111 (-),score=70.15 TRINITY_DN30733_c0_g1_i3:204-536(-)